jgi:hypothetical protein
MAHMGVSWDRADKSPFSRKTGFEKVRTRLKASLAHPMEEPGLFVFEDCRHFIRTVPTLPRDKREVDDIDSNAEDHVYDETRYKIFTVRHQLRQVKITGI